MVKRLLYRITKGTLLSLTTLILVGNSAQSLAVSPKTDVIHNARVVFFGDSLTHYGTWPETLKNRFNLSAAINAGVGGNTSSAGLSRFDSSVKAHNPDFVIINFGMNDHVTDRPNSPQTSKEWYKYNLETIADKVRGIGAIPVFFTTSYMVEETYYTRHPKENYASAGGALQLLDDYSEIMRQVSIEKKVDLVDVRAECERYSPQQLLDNDGVHLASMGNQLYAKVIGNFLDAKYSKPSAIKAVTVKFTDKHTGKHLIPAIRFEGAAGARIRLVAREIEGYELEGEAMKDYSFSASATQEFVFQYANISGTSIVTTTRSSAGTTKGQNNTTTNAHTTQSVSIGTTLVTGSAEMSEVSTDTSSKVEEKTVATMTSADKTGEKNVNKPLVIILCLASIIVAAGGSFVVYRRLKNGFAKRKK